LIPFYHQHGESPGGTVFSTFQAFSVIENSCSETADYTRGVNTPNGKIQKNKNKAKLNLTLPDELRNKLEQMTALENRFPFQSYRGYGWWTLGAIGQTAGRAGLVD
jgi:hypothetical protein